MKPLLAISLMLACVLGGLAWFVLRGADEIELVDIEALEPDAEPAPPQVPEVALADPDSLDVPVEDASSSASIAATSSGATRVATKQIFGRVVDEGGANGLSGFKVKLLAGNETLGNASSDRDGHFTFPLTERTPLAIALSEYDGWQILDPRVDLSPEQARGDVEVLLHAKSLRSAPIAGRLIDESTGAPLPRFLLRFEDAAHRRADAVTDDEGRFATTVALAAGELRVFPFDHPERKRPAPIVVQHAIDDGAQSSLELRVASGPTFRVALTPQDKLDLSRMRMRLRAQGPEGAFRGDMEPLRTYEPPYGRPDESLWIRFPPLPANIERTEAIEARSNDGLWVGEAPVTAIKGAVPGVVAIQLDARAAIQGVVTDPSGAAVLEAIVSMHVVQPDEKAYDRTARTDKQGAYRFEYLRAGAATLTVRTIQFAPGNASLELRSGEGTTQDFPLDALPLVGPIRGYVTSETGTYEPDVTLALTRTDIGGRDAPRLRAKPTWTTKDGKRAGRFDFGDLPAATYRVALWEDDWYEWEPRSVQVEAPREDLVFLARDSLLVADLVIKVNDADNGLTLDDAHLVLETFEGERQSTMKSGDVVLKRYPIEKSLRWRLDKDGYPPQFGDLSSFASETLVAGRPRRTCEVSISPGWGDQLRIVKRRDQRPIAGVTVLIDGREVGKSNDNGVVRLWARDRPASVTLTLPGWQQVGKVDLRPPAARGWKRFNVVQMQPAPKKK